MIVTVISEWKHRLDKQKFRICFGDDPRDSYQWISHDELKATLDSAATGEGYKTVVLRQQRYDN